MGDQVLWYPGYDDKFVTLRRGQDIKLYEVVRVLQVNLMLHFGFWLTLTMMILTCGCIQPSQVQQTAETNLCACKF